MADQNNADAGGAFTRAFLPGLILGLVVGGLAGAVLPDMIGGGRSLSPIDPDSLSGEPSERDRERGALDDAAAEARDAIENAADDAGEAVDDAVEDAGDAATDLIDDATGDDGP